MEKRELEVRDANKKDVEGIHNTLLYAFRPYRDFYTDNAFEKTVLTSKEIKEHIENKSIDVIVALCNNEIAGTVTIYEREKGKIYMQSMAVKPDYQGLGIGGMLLNYIERRSKEKKCKLIILECYDPLVKAASLYKKFGFKRTGKERNYFGITVYEMKKEIDREI